jgi:stress-induced morphogen
MGEIHEAIRGAIAAAINDADVEVEGGQGGHFTIAVTSPAFAGKNTLERHRMVLGAIKELMAGDQAPVHAVDAIRTSTG